mmetsp:Transcript_15699/g.23289  ORF Transcript_15699/g.23289 Transcript_15699/m.23289 type:complete len:109 (+) Transcript_15699:2135-2461(+)
MISALFPLISLILRIAQSKENETSWYVTVTVENSRSSKYLNDVRATRRVGEQQERGATKKQCTTHQVHTGPLLAKPVNAILRLGMNKRVEPSVNKLASIGLWGSELSD